MSCLLQTASKQDASRRTPHGAKLAPRRCDLKTCRPLVGQSRRGQPKTPADARLGI
jgi:hypothetical protein